MNAVTSPDLQRFDLPGPGPEDVVMDREGRIVAGLEDGRVIRLDPQSGAVETIGTTGGRPLGLAVCADGRILICDSPTGLLRLDPRTGALETLVDRFEGRRVIFCSNVVEARDGTIYFSVSSARYSLENYFYDIVENVPTGRLFRLHTDGRVESLLDGLSFANGLALALDESWIAVAETGAQHVRRYWLKGDKMGESEIFARMDGFPDNMSMSVDGLVWVAIASPANPTLVKLHAAPMFVRRIVARLPETLRPKPERIGWVMAFDTNGRTIHDFRWTDGKQAMFTGVVEDRGVVYVGKLVGKTILSFPLA